MIQNICQRRGRPSHGRHLHRTHEIHTYEVCRERPNLYRIFVGIPFVQCSDIGSSLCLDKAALMNCALQG